MNPNNNSFWDVNLYKNNSAMQATSSVQLFLQHIKKNPLRGDESVLDMGCGPGNITAYIASLIPEGHVWGLDKSEAMINYAKNHYRADNLHFCHFDILSLAIQHQFDLVLSFWCVHRLTTAAEQLTMLKAVSDALKPGGRTFIMIPLKHPGLLEAIKKTTELPQWSTKIGGRFKRYFPDQVSYQQLVAKAGLKIIDESDFRSETISYSFKTEKALKRFMLSVIPHRAWLTEQQQNDFLDDWFKNYQIIVPQCQSRGYAMQFCYLILKAHNQQYEHIATAKL